MKLSQIRLMALEAHGSQMYGEEPYEYHLQHVAGNVAEIAQRIGGDKSLQMLARSVAWLHDILEDTSRTKEDLIQAGVPFSIVAAVDLLTRKEGTSHQRYLMNIVVADGLVGKLAWLVKVADTATNLQHSTMELNKKRVKKYTSQLQYLMVNSQWV